MPGEQEAVLCSIELHTNRVIMSPNYQMALVKKKLCSLPQGRKAKQRKTVISAKSQRGVSLFNKTSGSKSRGNLFR